MSGRPKNEIMTPIEMEKLAVETRTGNRLYSRTADGAEVVNALTARLAVELANPPQKIDLRNAEMVRAVAVKYVEACSHAGTIPSRLGLCRAMGISRQAVDSFIRHHPQEPSVETLRVIFDGFADTLNSAALTNACHPIVGIFTLKAQAGWRDTVTVEADPEPDPLGEKVSAETIAAKYKDLLDSELELPD